MSNQRIKLVELTVPLIMLTVIAGCGDEGHDEGPLFSISLSAANITQNSVELDIGSKGLSGPMELLRDGIHVADVDVQEGTTITYFDSNLTSGTKHCYKVGGFFWFLGWFWSNEVCVTTL